ncbi:nucleotidyltransferase family protein [Sphingomonas sp. SM33]|uniref:Nucleotidyltransferase family protein n=1 Tax=Sphingomonas telluris TaxID=2907998 RepID=A0ABS9VQE3_9SPHN|nr:NTP transferase domain-containing protein [Sphingomonas telluris]MCH8617195.1 nucleotidyltransferase family protein [Sphingomonas telluris]
MSQVTAIVLAGSRPGVDAFAQAYGTDLKALISIAGEPMVCRPVRALLESRSVERIRVLAQQPDRIGAVLPADDRVSVEASGGTIASTLEAFCLDPNTQWPLLVTTADHALLTAGMIDDFIAKAQGADIAIGLVERRSLLKRLPESQRTWLKFRGGAYSGANLFLLGGPQVQPALELWQSVEQDRKKVLRVLWQLGFLGFLGAALRFRTLQQALDGVGRKLGLTIRAVELSDPLAAVDVDKPADHQLVTAIIEGRA